MRRAALFLLMACARLEVAEDTEAFIQRPPASISSVTIEGTAPTPPTVVYTALPSGCSAETPMSTQPLANAKLLYQQGQEKYQLGAYEEAAKIFLEAYQAHPLTPLLYNVAQSYRQAGRIPEAIAYYQQFLCYETNEKRREDVQRRILELEERHPPNTPPPPPPG
jgi:tetratricopeptide (TPR) repeat protein